MSAVVHFIYSLYVAPAHAIALANSIHIARVDGFDRVLAVFRERLWVVVHDRVKVVIGAVVGNELVGELVEVVAHAGADVLEVDANVVIAVEGTLHMEKAEGVEELVNDDALV